MRTRVRRPPSKLSRGVAALLFALLLPLIAGFVALSVDTAVLATARAQLLTVADAAALAGAWQLADDRRLTGTANLTPEINAANAQAAAIGQANAVLGQAAVVAQNTANAQAAGDVLVGYLDPNNPSSALDPTAASAANFNSVQVTARRSSDHAGLVPTYFAKLMGFTGSAVSVQSTASVVPYSITGFQGDGTDNVHLLPMVLDQSTYNAMIAGTTQDQYTWNQSTQTVSSGPDGVTESVLYPVGSGSPGNWGTVKVGVSDNSTSTLGAQIQYGITPSQMAQYPNSTIQLDPSQTPPSITFQGNPGISAGLQSYVAAIVGQAVTIPVYDINGGNGNNAWYRVVAFAPVRVMASSFQGNPKYVIVQPALIKDSSAIAGTPYTSWTSGGLVKLHLSR